MSIQRAKEYFANTKSWDFSIVVTTPLLLLYNLVYFLPDVQWRNGVDLIGMFLLRYTGVNGFLGFNALLVLFSFVLFVLLVKKGRFSMKTFVLMVLEGLLYGFATGYVTGMTMRKLRLGPESGPSGFILNLILCAGAGYHEELFFRLLLLGGGITLAKKLYSRSAQWFWGGVILFATSVLFSLAHFLGAENFSTYAFWYRTIMGMLFGVIFLLRGFAVAAYTHFLYDVMVTLMHQL